MKTPSIRFCPAVITIVATSFAAYGTVHPAHAQPKAKTPAKVKAKTPAPAQTRYVAKGGYSLVVPAKWQKDDADISMERMRYALVTDDTR